MYMLAPQTAFILFFAAFDFAPSFLQTPN